MSQKTAAPDASAPDASAPDASAESVSIQLRRVMPDVYFINTPASRMPRHLDFLRRIAQEKSSLDFHSTPHSSLTELSICDFDDAVPGLLSKVCATLAAQRIDIQTAYVFTIQAFENTGRRIVLDTFWISETMRGQSRALAPKTVARVRENLTRVLAGESRAHLISPVHPAPLGAKLRRALRLSIEELSAINTAACDCTVITLRAQNGRGVLARITAALASLNLDIGIAQINTDGQTTSDVFFVTRNGSALNEAESLRVVSQLRALLQDESAATK